MMMELAQALTLLDEDPELWVGVVCAAGEHFTAGLDMPKFFGPKATAKPRTKETVDPMGLVRQCTKPIVTAVQGINYTIRIKGRYFTIIIR